MANALKVIRRELPRWWRDQRDSTYLRPRSDAGVMSTMSGPTLNLEEATAPSLPDVVDAALPSSISDLALYLAGGPVGGATRAALAGVAGATYSSDAEAGPLKTIAKATNALKAPPKGRLLQQELRRQGVDPADYYRSPTVEGPQRVTFPDIYLRPDLLAARAEVAPESPALRQLFGVTRRDLFDINQGGRRVGNAPEVPFAVAPKARGAATAPPVMNNANAQRLIDIVSEARKRPDLFEGMASWYTMDPAYDRIVQLVGREQAPEVYRRLNTFMGMASPNSEVLTEINRGTAANWLNNQGKFDVFAEHGGLSKMKRGPDYPAELAAVEGHMTHPTAQVPAMRTFAQTGKVQMTGPKVPSYIKASGVPDVGFQTQWPVGDAHWSRLVGLPDVRDEIALKDPLGRAAGLRGPNVSSATTPEMVSLAPWFRDKVAAPSGLEAVPAQAVLWGAGSRATGVTSQIGAPKLELLAQKIMETANRLGISPEEARDRVLLGQAHAGFINPKVATALALGAAGVAAGNALLNKGEKKVAESKNRLRDAERKALGEEAGK